MRGGKGSSLNTTSGSGGAAGEGDAPEGGDKSGGGSSFFGAVANLANAAVGAGVLAFPSAFRETGLAGGVVLTVLFAAIMGWTLHILGLASARAKRDSYQSVIRALLGPWAGVAIAVSMSLYLFGSCVAYLDIVSNQITTIADSAGLGHTVLGNRIFVVAMAALLLLPLCLLPRIEALNYASAVAVVSIVYLEGDVIAHAARSLSDGTADLHSGGVTVLNLSVGLFKALPVLAFALQCHLVYVPVYQSLRDKSLRTMDLVSVATYVLCFLLYVPTGLLGYMQFGRSTCSDIVAKNLPSTPDTDVARGAIALTAMLSYPLLHFVARTTLNDVFFGGASLDSDDAATGPAARAALADDDAAFSAMEPLTPGALYPADGDVDGGFADGGAPHIAGASAARTCGLSVRVRYLLLTLGFMGATVGTAAAVSDLGVVLDITGSTAAVVQVFLFPAALYLRIAALDAGGGVGEGRSIFSGAPAWAWGGAIFLCVFGTAMGVVSLVAVGLSTDPANCT